MVPRFDPHPAPRPSEPWEYVVDDAPPRFAPAGSARLLQPGHTVLRLVPDVGYRPWRNEAVMVLEKELEDGRVELRVRGAVVTGWYAAGADILDFDASVTDPLGDRDITIFCQSEYRRDVTRKVLKALDWYESERTCRERGWPRRSTSYEFWMDTRVIPRES